VNRKSGFELIVCALLVGSTIFIQRANAQFVQQGGKLVGSGSVGSLVYQGTSVSVSADGNTAIVGATGDNNRLGAVWVFTRTGSVWTQQGNKIAGSGAVGSTVDQGGAVSLSADGNTAIVGAYGDNSEIGATWVFTRTGAVGSQQGNKLVGTGGVSFGDQGRSCAISADGSTIIIGGPYDNGYKGAAWIFIRSASTWTQQGNKLVGSGATATSYQGSSVSLSADGNTALVGGSGDAGGMGAAWVFVRNGGIWSQQSKLFGTGAVGSANQGSSVSISADGNTALVGAFADNGYAGAAWVFTRSGSVWTQQGGKIVGSGAVGIAEQGYSVSLSSDGSIAIIGGDRDNGYVGAAWVFSRSGGIWTQQGNKMVGTGGVGTNISQGKSVAISGDGKTVIVGGQVDNNGIGASWVFYNPSTTVRQVDGTPQVFQLEQNYPNPFNPVTTIQFALPKTGFASLKVFDLLGREVATLINSEIKSGSHQVIWNASGFASGVYFYRLEAGSFYSVKKLGLQK